MNYCNNCDIAHEERDCPLCTAKDEIKRLDDELIKAEDYNQKLKDKIEELEEIAKDNLDKE